MAARIGREADKLVQRFGELGTKDRKRLLDSAFDMIEHARRANLSPTEREAEKLIDRVDLVLGLIASGQQCRIADRVQRGVLDAHVSELRQMGITYFGASVSAA